MSDSKYRSSQITLHWLIALLVLCQLFVTKAGTRGIVDSAEKAIAIAPHASIGFTILVLMLVRLWLRFRNPKPSYSDTVALWQRKIGAALHHLFYALLIIQPIVGLLVSNTVDFQVKVYGFVSVSGLIPSLFGMKAKLLGAHQTIAAILVLLISMHIIIAVIHAFRRDGVFSRMWFGSRR